MKVTINIDEARNLVTDADREWARYFLYPDLRKAYTIELDQKFNEDTLKEFVALARAATLASTDWA